MADFGIDTLGFYTAHNFIDLATLAKERDIDVNKFYVGLGQHKMSVPSPDEDIVTLGAEAAKCAVETIDVSEIDTLLFATETGIDHSKAAGIYIHRLLGLPSRCRVVELKQACHSGTSALQMAIALLYRDPNKKILIVMSDIARYGLGSPGESSQGCGAVAMVVSKEPRLLVIEPEYGLFTEDVMDFWRPNYRREALVDGHYSTKMYMSALCAAWDHYHLVSKRDFQDHDFYCYHAPIPRLVEKAHARLKKHCNAQESESDNGIDATLTYSRTVGNCYTASLYLTLLSLLDHHPEDMSGKRIGFYSYGSGCVAEFFSGVVQPTYRDVLNARDNQQRLADRTPLTYQEYEAFYKHQLPTDGDHFVASVPREGRFRLAGVERHQRVYENKQDAQYSAKAPGKLILSGEYAVMYGCPAIAFAVDRFVCTSVSKRSLRSVVFDLPELSVTKSITHDALSRLKKRLKSAYHSFTQGEEDFKNILKAPFELAQFVFINTLDRVRSRLAGLKVKTHSAIPKGCGMGSSAAMALSMTAAVVGHYGMRLTREEYLALVDDAEKLQHGYPSGLDMQTSFDGGCVYFHAGKLTPCELPDFPLYVVNTGTPAVSTGDCVVDVKSRFESDDPIWQAFSTLTHTFASTLSEMTLEKFKQFICENEQLLERLGVVPTRVVNFIRDIERANGSAKICGAGAISGDNAGMVLIVSDDEPAMTLVCQQHGFSLDSICVSHEGLISG
jgi:hydroxymethylglutaryl-CoA synthase